jgi:UDP-N-acetylmuramate dehydrogenase
MRSIVERVDAWFPTGARVLEAAELGYDYRASVFKRSSQPAAVLSVDLRLRRGETAEALQQIEQNEARRRANQPTERSCGSVFKNPVPDFAGRLIDTAGLKGLAVGDAQISERHGNFFVNRGHARAADVVTLMRQARRRVQEVHGVHLDVEILLVGEWPEHIRHETV